MTLGRVRSLQARVLWRTLALVGALWLAAGALVWWEVGHELDELLDAHLAQSAGLLVTQASHTGLRGGGADRSVTLPAGSDDDEEDSDEAADTPVLHRYARRVAFQVWHDGQLVLHSPNAAGAPLSTLTQGFETQARADGSWRLFAAQGTEADVQVYVAEEQASRRDILWAVLRGLMVPLLLGLPLVALSLWWSVRRGLAPLHELGNALAQRAPDDLAPVQLTRTPPAELAAPLAALNQLLARIGQLLESERRFTADAAHELRTPIAAVRTQAQVALGATDDAERRHALQATLAGCDRATHLVQQLLTLARLEAGSPAAAGEGCDLAALARRGVGEQVGTALARQQTIELDAPPRCPLPAQEALVSVLLRNLVDNALRYSPAGATVQVQVQETADAVTLQVDDSGPGLAEADLARLGERFFRVLGHEAPGSGLGWSIVRRIAAAQGAQVQAARSATLGGLAVTVRWPR